MKRDAAGNRQKLWMLKREESRGLACWSTNHDEEGADAKWPDWLVAALVVDDAVSLGQHRRWRQPIVLAERSAQLSAKLSFSLLEECVCVWLCQCVAAIIQPPQVLLLLLIVHPPFSAKVELKLLSNRSSFFPSFSPSASFFTIPLPLSPTLWLTILPPLISS